MDHHQSPNHRINVRSKLIRRARGLGAVFGILLVLSGGAATGLYLARGRVAALVAQNYLARYGIQSKIEFSFFGWGGFVARVRAGSPAAPEFTAEGVQVTLAYPGKGVADSFTPAVTRIRLIRPTLVGSFDGTKLSFGALQPLIDDILRQPAKSPKPDIVVESGTLRLATPQGPVSLITDAVITNGALRNLRANLQPAVLRGTEFAARLDGGSVVADAVDDTFRVRLALNVAAASLGARNAKNIDVQTAGRITWKINGDAYNVSVAELTGTINARDWDAIFARANRSTAEFALQQISATFKGGELHAIGRGALASSTSRFRSNDVEGDNITTRESFSALAVDVSPSGWKISTGVHSVTDGTGITYPIAGDRVSLTSAHSELDGSVTKGPEEFRANFRGTLDANGALPSRVTLRTLRAKLNASLLMDRVQSSIGVRTSVSANTNLSTAAALKFARAIPGIDENIASSLASAVRSTTITTSEMTMRRAEGGFSVTAREPVVIVGADGARIVLHPAGNRALVDMRNGQIAGGFSFDIGGNRLPQLHLDVSNYRYAQVNGSADVSAETQIQTALDYGSLRKLAIVARGTAKFSAKGFSFPLSDCSDIGLDAFTASGKAIVTKALMRFCGTAHPAFVIGKDGWSVDGRAYQTSATFPIAGTAAAGVSGDIQLTGKGAEIRTGILSFTQATLSDVVSDPRFRPVSASGTLKAAGSDWQGSFRLMTGKQPLADIVVRHSLTSGIGEADIDAPNLNFQPNAFQPEDIAPFLASFGSRVRGRADFTGRVKWSESGIGPSNGTLVLTNVDFQSRAGMSRQTNANLMFDSLLPIALHPSQTVTIGRIEMVVPLENVAATFSYTPQALRLEHVIANVAGGRASLDPLEYKFAPNATTAGTLRIQNINPMPLIAAAGLENRVSVVALVDGEVPFTIGSEGVHFTNGRLAANGAGHLSVKREALTASVGVGAGAAAPPNAVQDFAYQALENLSFESLNGTVNSRPMGRLNIVLHVKGQHDPAVGGEPRVSVLDLLRGHAFDKPLPLPKGTPIDLTLDTSLNLDELLNSYFGGFRESAGSARIPN
jgi:hypothetical protein